MQTKEAEGVLFTVKTASTQYSTAVDQMLCLRDAQDFGPFVQPLRQVAKASQRHLDVGCSSGGLLELLATLSPTLGLFGIDQSEERLAMARERVPQAALTLGDANEVLPYPDEFFDSVTCFEVIEHLLAPGRLAFEISRVLRKGGILFLTTPNANAFMRWVLKPSWYGLGDPSHLIFFSAFTLRVLLERSGFGIERAWTESRSAFPLYDSLARTFNVGGQLCVLARKKLAAVARISADSTT